MDQKVKTCSVCKLEKPASTQYFAKKKGGQFGIAKRCKSCISKLNSEEYLSNHEENKKKARVKNCAPERRAYMREYYEKNKETITSKFKKYYENNKEPYLRRSKEVREKNPEATAEYLKQYNIINKKRINKQKLYKIKHDLNYKIRNNVKRHLTKSLKEFNCKKTDKTMNYHGCTIKELIQHLESTWSSGMNWENYGSFWVIDHIKPIAMFNFEQKDEIYKCFHYTNLQALPKKENAAKCDRIYETNGRQIRAIKQAAIIAPKLNFGYASGPFDFMLDC